MLEQKLMKEMEDKDDEMEALQKALSCVPQHHPAPAAAASLSQDMTAKLCSRLVDQVKRLEEVVDSSTAEHQVLSDRSRDSTQALRRLQVWHTVVSRLVS